MSCRKNPVLHPPAIKAAFLSLLCVTTVSACQSHCLPQSAWQQANARNLRVGESAVRTVYARLHHNDTLLAVKAGQTYEFVVDAKQTWCDAGICKSADGYPSKFFQKPFESGRRLPSVDWFVLCGEVDKQEPFPIGAGTHYHRCQSSGLLSLFANDHPLFYWNNSGEMRVLISRKK
jgi:hypothetical protein